MVVRAGGGSGGGSGGGGGGGGDDRADDNSEEQKIPRFFVYYQCVQNICQLQLIYCC